MFRKMIIPRVSKSILQVKECCKAGEIVAEPENKKKGWIKEILLKEKQENFIINFI